MLGFRILVSRFLVTILRFRVSGFRGLGFGVSGLNQSRQQDDDDDADVPKEHLMTARVCIVDCLVWRPFGSQV